MNHCAETDSTLQDRMQFYAKCREFFRDKYFWAKTNADGLPGCEVWQHSIAAAEVIRAILKILPEYGQLLPDGIITLTAVHDVGKISPGFQTKCNQWTGPDGQTGDDLLKKWGMFFEKRHARSTYDILLGYYKENISKKGGRFWADCAGAHHGVPVDSVSSGMKLPELWLEYSYSLIELMIEWYGALPSEKTSESIKRVITGAIIVSDWIASHEELFPPIREIVDYRQKAEEAVRKIGWQNLENFNGRLHWHALFPHCSSARPLQQYMWNLPARQGIYVVEDTMGGGKTEASLSIAYHLLEEKKAHGIYFALPTQTTSNRIFYRMKSFVEACGVEVNEASLQLSHGASWLLQGSLYINDTVSHARSRDDGSAEMRRWFSSAKRSLLVPFGVGTVDQALMSVVAVKHRDVRAFALAGKIVILDEVHSYDFYTGSLISVLVRQLCETGATVIVLSATLTQTRVRELLGVHENESLSNDYPLVTSLVDDRIQQCAFPPDEQKIINVDVVEKSAMEVAEHAYEQAMNGQCVLWIRNTVKEAQEALRLLKNEAREGGPEIALLHARFPYWRREELENCWIDRLGRSCSQRPQGCVLVATQVVEQSVDIDADYLITDFAPTDMLLQRAGRLWRHPRTFRPCDTARMMVVLPYGVRQSVEQDDLKGYMKSFGSSAKVYAPYVLCSTWRVWRGLQRVSLPDDIRGLIENTYDESFREQSQIARETYRDMNEKAEACRAYVRMNQSYSAGVGADSDGVFTRYGQIESAQVLLLNRKPGLSSAGNYIYEPLHGSSVVVSPQCWSYETAKSIFENSVKIPRWQIGELSPDPNLAQYGVEGIFPFFVLESGDLVYYSGEPSCLAWNEQQGVYMLHERKEVNDESEFMY